MKKVILLLALSCIFTVQLIGQSNPEGMNYQAVARNLRGEILATQPISLRVVLFNPNANGNTEYYTEVHDVVTSTTGVFSLVVGKGKKENGSFENIPWSRENIWMEVSIKSRGKRDLPYQQQQAAGSSICLSCTDRRKAQRGRSSAGGNPANNWTLAWKWWNQSPGKINSAQRIL